MGTVFTAFKERLHKEQARMYGWSMVYPDGRRVEQYPPDGPEVNLGEQGFDNHHRLSKDLPAVFKVGPLHGVNLQTGAVMIKGRWQPMADKSGKPLTPVELVYFRRNRLAVNPGAGTCHTDAWHFVGYRHADGEVRLCIPGDGSPAIICV